MPCDPQVAGTSRAGAATVPRMHRPTRVAVRVVLLDPSSRVLLFEGRDLSDAGDTVRFWFTAGGGVEDGETLEAAAERELREETGLSGLRLTGPFDRREIDFLDHGEPQHQVEHFFAARTADVTLRADGWTDLERRAVTACRWWSADELATAGVRYFPDDLVALLPVAESLLRAAEQRTGPVGPAADRP